jgi:outer membrane lipoprotein-sorting protein
MCKRLSSLVLILLIFSAAAVAQYQGFRPVSDPKAFAETFAKQSATIMSISSNFSQEKVLSALAEKISSTGKFDFKRSDKVRLQYIKPFNYLMVMNGDRVLVKDERGENRINTKSNRLFQQVNRIMADCLQGKILSNKDFSTKAFEGDGAFLLEMTPVSKNLKTFFSSIVVKIDKRDYSLQSMQMNEQGGDYTLMTFTDKKINAPIPDDVFAF